MAKVCEESLTVLSAKLQLLTKLSCMEISQALLRAELQVRPDASERSHV